MSDVKCPYCGTEQEICHDDGYGFDEDVRFDQYCVECGRDFQFTTHISYSHSVYCANNDHDMELVLPERYPDFWGCVRCEHRELRQGEKREQTS